MLHRSVFIEMSGSVICGISFCNSFLQVLHPLRRMQLFLLHTEGSDCVVCIRHVVSVYICGCCCICIEACNFCTCCQKCYTVGCCYFTIVVYVAQKSCICHFACQCTNCCVYIILKSVCVVVYCLCFCCRCIQFRRWLLLHKRLRFQVFHLLCQGLLSELLC